MQFKISKKTDKYYWTQHSLMKMKFYGLSQQRVTRVIKNPQRIEEGIVENTIAVMQPPSMNTKDGKKAWTSEIWAMYQVRGIGRTKQKNKESLLNKQKQFKIISVWRYPGVSPKRNPIPQEILEELTSFK